MKVDGWYSRLVDYLDKCDRMPFEIGVHDCALFAAGAVQAQTGVDIAARFRGYKTLVDGFRRMSKAGFADHIALADATLTPIVPSMAQDGDIVAVDGADGQSLGVLAGAHVRVVTETGMGILPRDQITRAWSVWPDIKAV